MARVGGARPTDPACAENWLGGYYELSIKLGPPDDRRLDDAVRTLWAAAGLRRAFRRGSRRATTPGMDVGATSILAGELRSIARIPGLGSVLCCVMVARDVTDAAGPTVDGADWLDLSLPLGALSNLDRRVGGYPFDIIDSRGWRTPLEQWFERIGRAVFDVAPFAHAVTGFEVSGLDPAAVTPGRAGLLVADGREGLRVSPVTRW